MMEPVDRASAVASARARSASRDSRAVRSTSRLTPIATATNTPRAMTLSVLAMVQVWTGGVRYQFVSSDAATDATSARPDAADGGDHQHEREVEQQRAAEVEVVAAASTNSSVSSGSPTRHSTHASVSRCRGTAREPTRRDGERRRRACDGSASVAMMCTSTPAGAVADRSASEPLHDLGQARPSGGTHHHLRGLLGSGERGERGGDVVADHLAVRAAQFDEQRAVALELMPGGGRQAVGAGDVHADQVAAQPAGHPRRTADEVLAARRRR